MLEQLRCTCPQHADLLAMIGAQDNDQATFMLDALRGRLHDALNDSAGARMMLEAVRVKTKCENVLSITEAVDALRKDSDYLVTSELMRAEVIRQRDALLEAVNRLLCAPSEANKEFARTVSRPIVAESDTPVAINNNDFAKIVRASDGRQVLYYIEPAGGDYHVHQVTNHEGFQADLTLGFTHDDDEENQRLANAVFDAVGRESADRVIETIARMAKGGVE